MARPWIPQVRYPVVHGSSQWMREMAFVIKLDGERRVLLVTIESRLPSLPQTASTFSGYIHSSSPLWPGKWVHGYYDTTFRQPGPWLTVHES